MVEIKCYIKSLVESQNVRAMGGLKDQFTGSQSWVHDKVFTGPKKTGMFQ